MRKLIIAIVAITALLPLSAKQIGEGDISFTIGEQSLYQYTNSPTTSQTVPISMHLSLRPLAE